MAPDLSQNSFLVQYLRRGDEDAFRYLVQHYQYRLLAFVRSLGPAYTDPQDIVQNVFVKTWKHRKRLDPQQSIRGFLFRTVYREYLNSYNFQKNQKKLLEAHSRHLQQIADADVYLDLEALMAYVNTLIQSLPPKQKIVFQLHKQEGLSYTEISDYLDISVKTVEARMSRAYTYLRKQLSSQKPDTSGLILFLLGLS